MYMYIMCIFTYILSISLIYICVCIYIYVYRYYLNTYLARNRVSHSRRAREPQNHLSRVLSVASDEALLLCAGEDTSRESSRHGKTRRADERHTCPDTSAYVSIRRHMLAVLA